MIKSLLDLDFYKLTMAQVAWRYYCDVPVKYSFKNRTKSVALAKVIRLPDLLTHLAQMTGLRFTQEESAYLREGQYIPRGLFKDDFLDYLSQLKLAPIYARESGDTFEIEVTGTWPEAILWETLILSTVNELYYGALIERDGLSLDELRREGDDRLASKIAILKHHPDIKIIEFGTRRRFSGSWQKHVTAALAKEAPGNLLGTSNVLLAKDLDLKPIGTFAHEMDMIFSSINHSSDEEIRKSHNIVLRMWWAAYGEPLSIALTDTYGSDFFFRDFTPEQARSWRGLRQDSGDPVIFGEKAIDFYKSRGIDPKTKLIVFSDGLDINAIVYLNERFKSRIDVAFGWGTNLTNDLGLAPLSLVVKATEACGHGTVKLSDNLAKATGSPEDIERFKRIFGYDRTDSQECRY